MPLYGDPGLWDAEERGQPRHAGLLPFPQPEGVAGQAKVWLWTDVNRWLDQLGLADTITYPTRDEMTDIDYLLRYGRLLLPEHAPIHRYSA